MKTVGILLLFALVSSSCANGKLKDHGIIKINPLFNQPFLCAEHAIENMGIGDAYGRDCMITKFVKNKKGKWHQMHRSNGYKNSDWFSWKSAVLAPVDGTVVKVYVNSKVNKPGIPFRSRASAIVFKSSDDTMVIFAHVREPLVKEGDIVTKGQIVARVGNNGNAWMPHIHVGAWKGTRPLQIVFDLLEWEKTIQKLYPGEYNKQ